MTTGIPQSEGLLLPQLSYSPAVGELKIATQEVRFLKFRTARYELADQGGDTHRSKVGTEKDTDLPDVPTSFARGYCFKTRPCGRLPAMCVRGTWRTNELSKRNSTPTGSTGGYLRSLPLIARNLSPRVACDGRTG